MAGHSKFSNIKHRKAKQDAAKSKVFTRVSREIAVAVKEGGKDPEMNARLRNAIDSAREVNMPNANIERSIKRALGDDGGIMEEITYEGYGPKGVAVIVKAITDNRNRTATNVRSAFTKGAGNLGTTGCVSFMFDTRGQIMIEKEDTLDEDELMLLVIEAGALDFNVEEEGYEILTEVQDFIKVRDVIKEAGIEMLLSEITEIPQTFVTLEEEADIKSMDKLLDLLDDEDDVQHVYHNWEE